MERSQRLVWLGIMKKMQRYVCHRHLPDVYAKRFATLWLASWYHTAGTTFLPLTALPNLAETNCGQHNPNVLSNKYWFSTLKLHRTIIICILIYLPWHVSANNYSHRQVKNSLNENYVVPCICLRAIWHTHDSCYSSVARHIEPCICHIALRHIHGTT